MFDTETATDTGQALLYGAWREYELTPTGWICLAEGLFHADDLELHDPAGVAELRSYAASHAAEVAPDRWDAQPMLQLLSRREFVNGPFWRHAYKARSLIVGFNLPFDLSRLAVEYSAATGRQRGGFGFSLWQYQGGHNRFRPLLFVRHVNRRLAFVRFGARQRPDPVDLIADYSPDVRPDPKHVHRGQFLDAHTLLFALTNTDRSLAQAAEDLGLRRRKSSVEQHGVINTAHIEYCRNDVAVTAELAETLVRRYDAHPIDLAPTQAFSPASIAKAYLRSMRVRPVLAKQPDFPAEILGAAMSAFYGGRAECRLRRVPVPIMLVDFTSMYPTVDVLMNMWLLLIADQIEVIDCTAEIQAWLDTVTLEDCFRPELWPTLVGLGWLQPSGDVLPVRADYQASGPDGPTGVDGGSYTIGIQPYFSAETHCYALPDLLAAKLATGKAPRIDRAVRLVPRGVQPGLAPTRLLGQVEIDPVRQDFFREVITERLRTRPQGHADNCTCQPCVLAGFLKVLANAGSYGIFAQMDPAPTGGKPTEVEVVGAASSWTAAATRPEDPGEFCFPPIAACITAAARLMLMMLERCVTDLGGWWVLCDTDSMGIITTATGTPVPCENGPIPQDDAQQAIGSLSAEKVSAIQARFNQLSPWPTDLVPQLLGEKDRGQCYVLSAKRYTLFDLRERRSSSDAHFLDLRSVRDDADFSDDGDDPREIASGLVENDVPTDTESAVVIGKHSAHSLAHVLPPPGLSRTEFIRQAWSYLVHHDRYDLAVDAEPWWLDEPVFSKITVSSPHLLAPFRAQNATLVERARMRPFNFALVAHVAPFGHPQGADPQRFRLIAPFTTDPTELASTDWRNLYDPTGPTYQITTSRWDHTSGPRPSHLVEVASFRGWLKAYRDHPEAKYADVHGQPCVASTRGLLYHRPVTSARIRHIGKETNNLDDVEIGLARQTDVTLDYGSPDAMTWEQALAVLAPYSGRTLGNRLGIDRRTIDRYRSGSKPRDAHKHVVIELASDIERATRSSTSDETHS